MISPWQLLLWYPHLSKGNMAYCLQGVLSSKTDMIFKLVAGSFTCTYVHNTESLPLDMVYTQYLSFFTLPVTPLLLTTGGMFPVSEAHYQTTRTTGHRVRRKTLGKWRFLWKVYLNFCRQKPLSVTSKGGRIWQGTSIIYLRIGSVVLCCDQMLLLKRKWKQK